MPLYLSRLTMLLFGTGVGDDGVPGDGDCFLGNGGVFGDRVGDGGMGEGGDGSGGGADGIDGTDNGAGDNEAGSWRSCR